MRLLHTKKKKLSEFQGRDIPEYVILSHVWGEEEVLFQDMISGNARKKKGFAKLRAACAAASKKGWSYIWIDTCCINKESSTELSEAINSMYSWYGNAEVCYAYLADVTSDEDPKSRLSSFAMSNWFSRGWTLQELLAPEVVVFYAEDWVDIGSKASLRNAISTITGISTTVLRARYTTIRDTVPIAVRLSWAADRITTREEDRTYSLLGLFDINMPLLYGEGQKAFTRFQHEIIKKSDDHSIFAWRDNSLRHGTANARGMLAYSPSEYRGMGNVERLTSYNSIGNKKKFLSFNTGIQDGIPVEYSITKRGVHIQLPLLSLDNSKYLAFLKCGISENAESIALVLEETDKGQFIRVSPDSFGAVPSFKNWRSAPNPITNAEIFVKEDHTVAGAETPMELSFIAVVIGDAPRYGDICCYDQYPRGAPDWNPGPELTAHHHWIYQEFSTSEIAVIVLQNCRTGERFALVIGPRNNLIPQFHIVTDFENMSPRPDGSIAAAIYESFANALHQFGRGVSDRLHAKLPSGWTVHVSARLSLQHKNRGPKNNRLFHLDVQLMQSQVQPIEIFPWERERNTQGNGGMMVVAVAISKSITTSGYIISIDNSNPRSPFSLFHPQYSQESPKWSRHNGLLICSQKRTLTSLGRASWATRVMFKGVSGNSLQATDFHLVMGVPSQQAGGRFGTCIETTEITDVCEVLERNSLDGSYYTRLESGQQVSVTAKHSWDPALFDYVVNVHMQV
ncbi:heterokaryon incompatibility protein-domain-containing protein [Collybia nuda]|uniref:Heterokaryon incompatibility protein-domain-containing protein n=1 Tax=Collybia nuda TaxID=64659 RepID=A0A9P6CDR4_9AGAR|nr:heterokaryon incompatibility protein-domain-containing protein [Collybia nuda]